MVTGGALIVLVGLLLGFNVGGLRDRLFPKPPPAPQLTERRLTANPNENTVYQGAISPDGKYLAYSDPTGMHLKLIQTGETLSIPQPEWSAPDRAVWLT